MSSVQDQHVRFHRRSCRPASWLACRQKSVVDRRHRFLEDPWFDSDEGVPRPLMAGSRKTGSSRLRHEEGVCGCGLLLKHLMTEVKVVRLSERKEMTCRVGGWAENRRGCDGEAGFGKHM